eukprot:scaffold132973_cov24-Phaeocystis_antarctica.AAC.1
MASPSSSRTCGPPQGAVTARSSGTGSRPCTGVVCLCSCCPTPLSGCGTLLARQGIAALPARQGIAAGLLEVHRAPPRTHLLADCSLRSHYLAPSSE